MQAAKYAQFEKVWAGQPLCQKSFSGQKSFPGQKSFSGQMTWVGARDACASKK